MAEGVCAFKIEMGEYDTGLKDLYSIWECKLCTSQFYVGPKYIVGNAAKL